MPRERPALSAKAQWRFRHHHRRLRVRPHLPPQQPPRTDVPGSGRDREARWGVHPFRMGRSGVSSISRGRRCSGKPLPGGSLVSQFLRPYLPGSARAGLERPQEVAAADALLRRSGIGRGVGLTKEARDLLGAMNTVQRSRARTTTPGRGQPGPLQAECLAVLPASRPAGIAPCRHCALSALHSQSTCDRRNRRPFCLWPP